MIKNIIKTTLTFILGLFFVFAGVQHIIKPMFYLPFVPDFLPARQLIVHLSGIIEIILGIGLFFPIFRKNFAIAILLLLVLFLPIHFCDLFTDTPAIGSTRQAQIRFPLQFVFIGWAAYVAWPFSSINKIF